MYRMSHLFDLNAVTSSLWFTELDSGNHSSEEELEEIYKGEPAAAAATSSAKAGPPIPTAVASAEVRFISA